MPADYLENDFSAPQPRSQRPFVSGWVVGPLELVETRGKIRPKEVTSWELNADGTATFATAPSGTARVSLVGARVEWDGVTHTETIKAKIEETQTSTTSVLRLDPAQLNAANQRAWISLTSSSSGGTADRIDLRTGTGVTGDTRIGIQGTLMTLVAGTTFEARTEGATYTRSRLVMTVNDIDAFTQDATAQQLARLNLSQSGAYLKKFHSGGSIERSTITLTDASVVINSKDSSGVVQGQLELNQTKTILKHDASGGVVEVQSPLRHTSVTAASLASTTHAFQIGPTNSLNLRMGVYDIQAVDNGAANDLHLNEEGGAILGRSYQIAPVRAISGNLVGSGSSATSLTQLFYMQCGYATSVSFSGGQGTVNLPATFTNGIIFATGICASLNDRVVGIASATTSSITFTLYDAGSAYNSTANISWLAIGW